MLNYRVVEYINLIADTIRNEQAFEIEGRTFTSDDFPPGFWRQLAKEVNYLYSLDIAHHTQKNKPIPPPLRDEREGDLG